jgi:hypothetical protein
MNVAIGWRFQEWVDQLLHAAAGSMAFWLMQALLRGWRA